MGRGQLALEALEREGVAYLHRGLEEEEEGVEEAELLLLRRRKRRLHETTGKIGFEQGANVPLPRAGGGGGGGGGGGAEDGAAGKEHCLACFFHQSRTRTS